MVHVKYTQTSDYLFHDVVAFRVVGRYCNAPTSTIDSNRFSGTNKDPSIVLIVREYVEHIVGLKKTVTKFHRFPNVRVLGRHFQLLYRYL